MDIGKKCIAKFLVVVVLAMPGINQGMETEGTFSTVKYFYRKESWPFASFQKNLQQVLFEVSHPQSDLVDMENLLLGAYKAELKELKIQEGETYKLWASYQGKKEQETKNRSLFSEVQEQFGGWAKIKREYVERKLGMPEAGSVEEEPYLFKKGWFDASPFP